MRTIAIATIMLLGSAVSTTAYPISPVFLWALVEQADAVVLARVEGVDPPREVQPGQAAAEGASEWPEWAPYEPSVATLLVHEAWKGTAPSRIRVPFSASMVCPSPPRFVAGETLAVFLLRGEPSWSVVGLSYGTWLLEAGDIAPLRDRVREADALQARSAVGRAHRVEWLVASCEHPITRRDALRELAPKLYVHDRQYDHTDRPRDLAASLSEEQWARVLAAVTSRPPSRWELPLVVHLFRRHRSAELTRVLRKVVEDGLADGDQRHGLVEAMAAVAERLRVRDASTRFERLDYDFDRRDFAPIEEFREAWEEAMAEAAGADR